MVKHWTDKHTQALEKKEALNYLNGWADRDKSKYKGKSKDFYEGYSAAVNDIIEKIFPEDK